MARLQTLRTPEQAAQWLRAQGAAALRADSRAVRAGEGFVAWPGAARDGRAFVVDALAQGAAACLVEDDGADAFLQQQGEGVASAWYSGAGRIARYPQLKAATGPIASAFYREPSHQVDVLAVTGTNGKTSTAWWLAQALSALQPPRRCGVVGTLGIGVPPAVEHTGLTTPDPVQFQHHLRAFADEGFVACAIEASSIGLAERRLDGTRIRVAIFTNFTQDHLDYHGSMDAYWQAKAMLFDWPGLQAAVVNIDDEKGAELARALSARKLDLWTVRVAPHTAQRSGDRGDPGDPGDQARIVARELRHDAGGLCFDVVEGSACEPLRTTLVGNYNAHNLLGVIGAMRALGVPLADAVRACARLEPVPGRMERVGGDGTPLVAVDYAHTPDALRHALVALRPLADARGGALWCVFGCGGDRDAGKRPLMGAVAGQLADRVVVTSDNPRSERPEQIISQILLGLEHGNGARERVQVQADRAQAIAQAVAQARASDVILVAGKGHEAWQEIAGAKRPFSDRAHALAALRRVPAASGAAA